MRSRVLERIREKIRLNQYDMTYHAVEEMAENGLNIFDVEYAVLNGMIKRRQKDDPLETKYTIYGTATDRQTKVAIVGRFKETSRFLIITVYKIKES